MIELSQILFICICAIILCRFYVLTAKGMPERGLVSALACLMYILCLFISAKMQAANLTGTKLLAASVLGPARPKELIGLSLSWSAELAIVTISEVIMGLLVSGLTGGARGVPIIHRPNTQYAAIILVIIGAISTVLFQSDITERAVGGQGIFTILKTCLVVGLCIISFEKCFGKVAYIILLMSGVLILIAASVRSPVFSIAVAYFAGLVSRRELTSSSLYKMLLAGVFLAVVGATMSEYRAGIIQRGRGDFPTALTNAVQNPFVAIYGGGIDTLDGYRLAQRVQPHEKPRPSNVFVAITTFVPRAFWPGKPVDLSIEVTRKYLHWGEGGIFLSLVGYLRIAFGGHVMAMFALALLTSMISVLYRKNFTSFLGFILILVTFRLFLAGSPFDVYYGLVFFLIYRGGLSLSLLLRSALNAIQPTNMAGS